MTNTNHPTTQKEERVREILGVYYVSPHAPEPGKIFKEPRCGDCWCTIQEVHTHSQNEDKVKKIMELFQEDTKPNE